MSPWIVRLSCCIKMVIDNDLPRAQTISTCVWTCAGKDVSNLDPFISSVVLYTFWNYDENRTIQAFSVLLLLFAGVSPSWYTSGQTDRVSDINNWYMGSYLSAPFGIQLKLKAPLYVAHSPLNVSSLLKLEHLTPLARKEKKMRVTDSHIVHSYRDAVLEIYFQFWERDWWRGASILSRYGVCLCFRACLDWLNWIKTWWSQLRWRKVGTFQHSGRMRSLVFLFGHKAMLFVTCWSCWS